MKVSTSQKTTISGVIMIATALLVLAGEFFSTGTVSGASISTAGTAIVGGIGLIFARDNNKTSEEVGADVFAADRARSEAGY